MSHASLLPVSVRSRRPFSSLESSSYILATSRKLGSSACLFSGICEPFGVWLAPRPPSPKPRRESPGRIQEESPQRPRNYRMIVRNCRQGPSRARGAVRLWRPRAAQEATPQEFLTPIRAEGRGRAQLRAGDRCSVRPAPWLHASIPRRAGLRLYPAGPVAWR